jgi:ribulose-5-phosphate 4-epimerase/fuculose-1-phosphate aldolase
MKPRRVTSSDESGKRQAIIDACRRMNALGINQGTSGNISVRHEGRMACPRGHHGMIAVGPSRARAFWLAVEVETLARQYRGCLQIGKPPLLSKAEIELVRGKMAGYGHADG